MTDNQKKTKQPIWLYAILGVLAILAVVLLVNNRKTHGKLDTLLAEKEEQRLEFQAEVDSLLRVHNELKENYGELSAELAEKDLLILFLQ